MRRDMRWPGAILGICLGLCPLRGSARQEASAADMAGRARVQRPNVILVLADDLSARDLALYGGSVRTPVLERMARTGVFFHDAWSAPLCGPSRAILHTGKYPHHQGYYENQVTPKVPFFRDARHLQLLKMARQAGYATGMFGKIHHGGEPAEYGAQEHCLARYWDGYDGPFQKRTEPRAGMYAISWYWHPGIVVDGVGLPTRPDDFGPDIELEHLVRFIGRNKDRPFFAYWPSNLPHMAHDPATGRWNYTDVPERDAAGHRTGGRVKGSLASTVGYLDALVGSIVTHLERLGIADRTIIFFASDNGTANGDKGSYERDRAIRVPFLVSGGPVRRLGESRVLVDFTDIWPTIAELVGHAGAVDADGKSLAPLLLGQPFVSRETIRMAMGDGRWIRDADWLLDGRGRFWDTRGAASQDAYRDASRSGDPDAVAARERFDGYLRDFPPPDENDPMTRDAWRKFRFKGKRPLGASGPPAGGDGE